VSANSFGIHYRRYGPMRSWCCSPAFRERYLTEKEIRIQDERSGLIDIDIGMNPR